MISIPTSPRRIDWVSMKKRIRWCHICSSALASHPTKPVTVTIDGIERRAHWMCAVLDGLVHAADVRLDRRLREGEPK